MILNPRSKNTDEKLSGRNSREVINSKHPFESIKVVVPSRRASLFLKNALARQIQKPAFAPDIVSIENFVEELSTLKKVVPVDLIFEFYAAYKEVSDQNTGILSINFWVGLR